MVPLLFQVFLTMKCHYDVLGIERNANDADIKKAYRKLALEWHPDKNPDRVEECTQYFGIIQQAYDTLTDPQERAWYDRHREQILKGGTEEDGLGENAVNVFPYFCSSCYSGYSDDEKGFYTVYRNLFEAVANEDLHYLENADASTYPSFGKSDSDYDTVVHLFYAFWSSYTTARSFSWLDKYDILQAENRRILRLMEKENEKLRSAARKERNEEIRALVAFVRKRDRRVQAYRKMLEEKKVEREKQVRLEREKQKLETQLKLQSYKEHDWNSKHLHEQALIEIEAALRKEFHSDQSETESESGEVEEEGISNPELAAVLLEESLFCVACDKAFKSKNSYDNHVNSKKHRDNVAHLQAQMAEEELALLNLKPLSTKAVDLSFVELNENENTADGNSNTEAQSSRFNKKAKRRNRKQKQASQLDFSDSDDEHLLQNSTKNGSVVETNETGNSVTVASESVERKDSIELFTGTTDSSVAATNSVPEVAVALDCSVCGRDFPSRNKLFAHLKESGHAALRQINTVSADSLKTVSTKKSKRKVK